MEMVIFIGIQGSGKSSFFKERFYDTHVRINRDMLKTVHRERALVETCLRTRQRCVIDNTNPQAANRAYYLQSAKAAGFRVIGYYFRCTPADAIARNEQRLGKAKIPKPGILGTHKRLEVPSLAEGYDELYCVTLDACGVFRVEPASSENLTKAGRPSAERGSKTQEQTPPD